jgi:hypothetical protein
VAVQAFQRLDTRRLDTEHIETRAADAESRAAAPSPDAALAASRAADAEELLHLLASAEKGSTCRGVLSAFQTLPADVRDLTSDRPRDRHVRAVAEVPRPSVARPSQERSC